MTGPKRTGLAVAPEEHEPFWRRHLVFLLVGGFACLLAVIVLIQAVEVDVSALLADVPEGVAYLLTFLFVWFDAVIPIFPGETTLSAASTQASEGELELGLVMLAGALGAIVGDSSLFWLVRKNAHKAQDQVDKALESPKIKIAWSALHRSTGLLLVVGRFVPGMRFVVNATMGLSAVPYRRFLPWSILGGTVWSIYTCALAYAVATRLSGYPLSSIIISGLITTAALAAVFFIDRRRRRRSSRAAEPDRGSGRDLSSETPSSEA